MDNQQKTQAGGVTLRGYRPADLDALYALDVACFEPPFRFSRAMVRQAATAANAEVVVAERDGDREGDGEGHIVGFAVLHVEALRGGRVGYLVTLDVTPAERRRGVARRMLAELEQRARRAGCAELMLHVFTGNADAIAFYERLDFVRTGVARNFYARGCDAWVYGKRVADSG